MRYFFLILFAAGFLSCATGDTEKDYSAAATADLSEPVEDSSELLINEFSPKSEDRNEFGEKADWIELYNASDREIEITSGTWSLSDDKTKPDKYVLPDTLIPAFGHLLIWCDDRDSKDGTCHSRFKLSGNGETLYLFKNGEPADEISYDEDVKKSFSYGRVADGSVEWDKFKHPTPGHSNGLFNHYAEALQ
ncbi:MAG: lamin tail domain-containing protein [Bacteroidetes bacterium]|nr:lamin tail domain-containing protein [Bacteroidota bacterium]